MRRFCFLLMLCLLLAGCGNEDALPTPPATVAIPTETAHIPGTVPDASAVDTVILRSRDEALRIDYTLMAISPEAPFAEDEEAGLTGEHEVEFYVAMTEDEKGGGGMFAQILFGEDHQGFVPRSARIKIKAYDCLNEREITFRIDGYPAIVLQHEIDHFAGTLFYDRINKENPWTPIQDAIVIE